MDQELYSVKRAAEMAKDPTAYSIFTYLWVMALSAWGGIVRYLNDIKSTEISIKTFLYNLLLNCSTSIFVGVTTFFLCEASNFQPLWTAVCVAVTGHMGAEGLKLLRTIVSRRLGG